MRSRNGLRIVAGAFVLSVLAGCSESAERDDSGAITEAGDLDAFKIKVGDCSDLPTGGDETASVAGIPCGEPHDYEVSHVFDLADGDFPGAEAVEAQGNEGCQVAFADYVGVALEDSELDTAAILLPSEDSWKQKDDREVICGVFIPGEDKLTGSVAGSGR